MSDAPVIFGSVTKVNEYNRQNGLKPIQSEPDKRIVSNGNSKAFQIGGDGNPDTTEVTDDELKMLKNILLRGNPEEVFMQEDVSFYDTYYLSNVKIDDALTAEVRKIRRIYRNYTKYLYACYIRDKYMDLLLEQYSDQSSIFRFIGQPMNRIPDDVFIPPNPIYSKHAEDYEKVMSGGYVMEMPFEEPSEEEIAELLQSLIDGCGLDPNTIEIDSNGVEVFKPVLESYAEACGENDSHSRYSGPSSVNVADLDMLQKMIRSWHKKEDDEKETLRTRVPFPKSENGMRELYYNEFSYYIMDHLDEIMNGEDYDPNELVYDDVTKRPMTRSEYNRRKTLRSLSENGGWDMVKLMSQMNVGSKIERKMAMSKNKRKKRARKKAASFFSDITGGNLDFDEPVTSVDELRKMLFE